MCIRDRIFTDNTMVKFSCLIIILVILLFPFCKKDSERETENDIILPSEKTLVMVSGHSMDTYKERLIKKYRSMVNEE